MKKFRKTALGLAAALTLCAAPMAWNVSAESGTAGDMLTWTLEDDFVTITALDGSFTVTSDGEILTITGTSYTHGLDAENIDELGAAFKFLTDNPASQYVIDVEEVNDLIPVLSTDEMTVVLTENVHYLCEDSLLMIPNYSIVTVDSDTLVLDGSGLGYDANGNTKVIGIQGWKNSPAEAYAAQDEAFLFIPIEDGGAFDGNGLYTWELKDDILTISATDGSFQIAYLPDEIRITGTSYTLSDAWEDYVIGHMEENLALLLFWEEYEADRLVFDVEHIESPYSCVGFDVPELVLTETVQSVAESTLYDYDATDVYVESKSLVLDGSYLGCYPNGEPVDDSDLTIHGYADTPAQVYADTNGFTFVAFDTPEDPASTDVPQTTTDISSTTASVESTSAPTTTQTTTTTATTSTTAATTTTTSTTTTAATTTTAPNGGIALLSMDGGVAIPGTGDKTNLPAFTIAGLTALLGGLLCRKKQ